MMRGHITTTTILIFILFSFGCRTYRIRPMPQMSASEAPARISSHGVDFGAKAFSDAGEVKATFTYNMLTKGLLPVHLVIDNNSASEIEIMRVRIELETPNGEVIEPIAADAASSGQGRNAMAEAIFFFGIFSYDNANKFNQDLQRDWLTKGMGQIQVLRPGRTMSKFLYFDVGKDFSPSSARLRVPFQRAGSTARDSVVLQFE